MKKTYIAQRLAGLASPALPAAMSREIGRIIVRWAYFEHLIQETAWILAGLSPAAGRIAMREPRAADRLQMVREILDARNGAWDDELYKSILQRTKLLAAKRDLLAHGIWGYLKQEHSWHVQLARGSWPKNVRDLVAGNKRVTPEAVHMDVPKLREAIVEIEAVISDLKKLRDSAIGPPAPWQETPR